MADFKDKASFDDAFCEDETEKALRVNVGGKSRWVPKSLVDDDSEVYEKGQSGILVVAEWFAVKEGWV